jgi:alpha-1,6-mannosyltransferase
MVLPGEVDHFDGEGLWIVQSTPLPFGQGYRMPLNVKAWTDRIVAQDPAIIEAGDPYVPGYAALRAGQRLGVPTVAFCHSDLGKLATLHLGGWATKTVRKYWLATCSQFDAVLAPSDYLAAELRDLGLTHALHAPLGVDVETFHPGAGLGGTLRRDLGVASHERLLVFAGRRALEKRVETLIDAVEKLGDGYRLLLVGGTPVGCNSDRVISMPYQPDSRKLAALLSQCDAFVHANPNEPLGLVVLEAMACGLPVVGVASGGIGETVDQSFGELAATSAPGPMAEAMAALFERDQAPLRAAARARAAQRHGWDVAFETLTRVYEGLTGDSAFGPTPGQGPVAVM